MKKISYLLLALVSFLTLDVAAQITSLPITLTREDGLPGVENYDYWQMQYKYISPNIQLKKPIDAIRITVFETTTGDSGGGYPCFALSEFFLYDSNGKEIELSVDNFSTNAQEQSEGPMEFICDRDRGTYFHSLWSWYNGETGFHYVEVAFPTPLQEFSFEYTTRYQNISPTSIEISDPNAEEVPMPIDSIYASIKETEKGSNWLLTVGLNDNDDEDEFTAMQMDVVIPQGLSVPDYPEISRAWASSTHTSTKGFIDDNTCRLILYSTKNTPFRASKGDICTLKFNAAGIPEGDYDVFIKNIRLTTVRGTEVELSDVSLKMHVSELSYTLTINLKEASQGYATGAGTYPAGSQVTIEAIPYEGFLFAMWSDGYITNPRVITLKKNMSITAIFKKDNSGVETITMEEKPLPEIIYDMLGRPIRTDGKQLSDLPKGIYIINGKKVIK